MIRMQDYIHYKPYTLESANILRTLEKGKGETYRFGIRAQYKTGIWSEVLYVGDYTPDIGYKTKVMDSNPCMLNPFRSILCKR